MSTPRETLDDETPEVPERAYRYAGRKLRTRLDYDTIEKICVAIADYGAPFSDLADSLALDPTSLREWRRKGEVHQQMQSPPEWQIYGDLIGAMRIASGEYGVKTNEKIHTDKEWFRFLKIAERRLPATYGVNPQGGSDQVFHPDDTFL